MLAEMLSATPDAMDGASGGTEQGLRRVFLAAAEQAIDLSPAVRQMYAQFQAASADVDEAKGQRWPQLTINGQTRAAQFGTNGSAYNAGNMAGANLTTTLYDWGKTAKTIASRSELANAGQARYTAQMEASAYQVVATLVELGRQRNLADLGQEYVDRMRKLVNMLEEIVAVDRGRGSELMQARARLMQAMAGRDAAMAKVRDEEIALRKLIGDSVVPLPASRQWPIAPANMARLLDDMPSNPLLLHATAEANAADRNREAVKAASKPQLNWVVSTNSGRDELGRRQPFQTMLTLSWNAFNGGSQKAATSAAGYRAEASWGAVEQLRLDLEYQVRTADQEARASHDRATQYGALVVETDKVRKAFYEQWYHLGKRSLLDVLTAESEYYGNRVSEVGNRFDAYQAVLREYSAGGCLVRWLREG
ncbi:TolC family protein [Burkholderia cenocepacia]|nr:TolC family protein [Burkholderia cenocepacia]